MWFEEDKVFLKAKKEYSRQGKLLYERYKKELEIEGIDKQKLIYSMPDSVEKSILIDRLIQLGEWEE